MTSLVWISGGSSGIGRALADTAPWQDSRVIDISRSGLDGTEHVAADLSTPEGWDEAAASFHQGLARGGIERAVFVHCAATLHPMGFAGEVDPGGYRRQVTLNSAAPQVLGDAWLRALAGHDVEAHLLVITSGAASSVYEGWSAYGPAKAAVDHWVRTVGAEQQRRGGRCRVISVAPGVVATPMQAAIRSTDPRDFPQVDRFVALHEDGELVAAEDAARGIWKLTGRELPNGSVVDLRDLG